MLLPDNVHPENTIYYNGYLILKELKLNTKLTMIDLYHNVSSKHNLSFSLFVLCLDWLYLISAATINNEGYIELCL